MAAVGMQLYAQMVVYNKTIKAAVKVYSHLSLRAQFLEGVTCSTRLATIGVQRHHIPQKPCQVGLAHWTLQQRVSTARMQ